MSVRRASTELLSQRFLHLHIIPRPANLSESREIYRVLQRFGDISKYYHLRVSSRQLLSSPNVWLYRVILPEYSKLTNFPQFEYHNPAANSALLIYRDVSSAQQALDASPIRFALEKAEPTHPSEPQNSTVDTDTGADELEDRDTPSSNPATGIHEILRPSALLSRDGPNPSPSPAQAAKPFPLSSPTPRKTTSKWFQVTVDRSHAVHQDYVERQPYWKHFNPMKSIAQQDLAKKVPHIGLSDVSKRPPHAHRTPNRVLAQMNGYLRMGRESLVKMWQERQDKGQS